MSTLMLKCLHNLHIHVQLLSAMSYLNLFEVTRTLIDENRATKIKPNKNGNRKVLKAKDDSVSLNS